MSEQKRNPITTLDEAVLWMAKTNGLLSFEAMYVRASDGVVTTEYLIGNNGFDARGAAMMAVRALWEHKHA